MTGQPAPRLRANPARVGGLLTGVLVAAGIAALVLWPGGGGSGGRADRDAQVPAAWQRPAVSPAGLAERSGVRIVRIAMSGDGGLLDLRYQVVDPARAVTLHDPGTPPAVVDERSGLLINRLFMDHAHKGQLQAARTYYLVFQNPGHWVHRGGKVTVLLGDAQVEHVVVQ